MEDSAPATEAPTNTENSSVGGGTPALLSSGNDQLLGGSTPASVETPEAAPAAIPNAQSWSEGLSDEFRNNPNINKYNSQDEFMRGHDSLARKIGEKNLEMPGEGSTTADWDKFYSKIGRPETVDKYTPYSPKMISDGEGGEFAAFEFDADQLAGIQKRFHGKGFSDSQMTEAMNAYAEITTQAQEAVKADVEQQAIHAQGELRREFGDKYDAKMASISAIADSLGIKDTLMEAGLGNNLQVIRMLDSLGSKIGESNITGDARASAGGFESRLSALKAHPGAKDKGHAEYNSIQAQIIDLYKNKYNG